MRKKLSPAVIVICLFAMTAGVLCVMFFMQNTVMKRVYGNEIRKDIFRINDLTETVMSELSALTADGGADTDGDKALPDAAALLFAAGELERCDLGGRIHELYDGLRKDTIQTVRDYAPIYPPRRPPVWRRAPLPPPSSCGEPRSFSCPSSTTAIRTKWIPHITGRWTWMRKFTNA